MMPSKGTAKSEERGITGSMGQRAKQQRAKQQRAKKKEQLTIVERITRLRRL
jgi:hypothetical protein